MRLFHYSCTKALGVLALLLASVIPAVGQDDTVWVQTLTFDSIATRRGIWDFPDGGDTYRKILMYHTLKCDPRTAQDKYNCGEWDYLTYTMLHRPAGDLEIGRFITPYGIGLDLGPNGFTWVYDVTDYAQYLRGSVDLSSGNQQELIDLRFAFIKGTPPRTVLAMEEIVPSRSEFNYRQLSDDAVLQEKTYQLLPEAEQFKIRTRLTGHGHNSNDGSYPHCCEWKDNTHYLNVNNNEIEWQIFQNDECALNPVYPQGGTWPGAREGWCPGDVVKDHDFEITPFIAGKTVSIDYAITPVPDNNPGMGGGVYVTTMQLFQYSAPAYAVDAEIYDVHAPSDVQYHSRKNPICADPVVVVRNNGATTITRLTFDYGVSGGDQQHFGWQGTIGPNEFATISLPVARSSFWLGDGSNLFTVRVSSPNGEQDQYAANDAQTTRFTMPDLYPGAFRMSYRTNKRASDYTLRIRDIDGDVVYQKENAENETLYRDAIDLPPGCYTLEMDDPYHFGLSYWAVPAQGSGYLRFYDLDGKLLKTFQPDFGKSIRYSFSIGDVSHVDQENAESLVALFPNPADEQVRVVIDEFPLGRADLRLYDAYGTLIRTETVSVGERFSTTLDTRDLPAGSYYITIDNGTTNLRQRFVKR